MNINQLSKRLEHVVNYIPKGSIVADIGSDHAYLPCFAVKKGIAKKAIAGEVAEGPFQAAKQQVEEAELENEISVRKGDGLEVIMPGEVDCITIAGMGGALITAILEEGKEKLQGVKRLILQPNISAINIRKWLIAHGWELIDEVILEEDEKIYEILVAEIGEPLKPYSEKQEQELLFGPILLKKKTEPFYKKWQRELTQLEKVLGQLEKAENQEQVQQKKQAIELEIQWMREVLQDENGKRS
ncbi:MAG TPA: tRNA (adenine(22)-N(1))-methyltransferase TrmK [Chondromyces sp.]|nr:tRNA (adenine(22)-N(1))-methyltransferase TrmK [Chondromyces sp.]